MRISDWSSDVCSSDLTKRIRARLGVVLATGGYDWKSEYVRAFDALPEAGSMAPPTVSGDHIAMAAKAGAIAIPARAPSQSPIFIGYKVPAEIVYGKTSYRMWLPGTPPCIAVNPHGKIGSAPCRERVGQEL